GGSVEDGRFRGNVAASGSRRAGFGRTRRGTRTTPSYSPTPTPKMTQHRSDSHRASGGNEKNMRDLLGDGRYHVLLMFSHPRMDGKNAVETPISSDLRNGLPMDARMWLSD